MYIYEKSHTCQKRPQRHDKYTYEKSHTCQKRCMCMSKEMYIYEKRPITKTYRLLEPGFHRDSKHLLRLVTRDLPTALRKNTYTKRDVSVL